VHARCAGAYVYFEPHDDSLADYTVAKFLTAPGNQNPVFVRFSTVAGSRGSADAMRDVRGFATKFYTEQGNCDLVGNKFPDFVHAVKPEPDNEIPQAQSAHDTLWDFVSLQPETLHTIIWLMSDRALPRSYRMMQGFGVHTFRFVNAKGNGTFVKFHWKPRLGVHSLIWDECQKVAGKDPDFNRRDLWDAIEAGQYPEWELGVQLVSESEEFNFAFDLLDATENHSRGTGSSPAGGQDGVQPRTRTTSSQKPSRWLSAPQMWYPASTSPTIRCCSSATSHIWILS
jgi:catalase